MDTPRRASRPIVLAAVLGFAAAACFFITTSVIIAWAGPTGAAPNNNVAAPVNIGAIDQVKNGGLSVNSFAVFGNAILSSLGGAGRYLNFGTTTGSTGYGFRDNAGVMQFRNSTGAWANVGSGSTINFQSFTSPGTATWTKPSNGSVAFIECWGGGGSGGKVTTSTSQVGGGGGGGAYMSRWIPLSALPTSVIVSVGAGGASATATGNGNAGAPSSFGSYITAPAGAAGLRGSASAVVAGMGGQLSPDAGLYNGGEGGDSRNGTTYIVADTVYGGAGGGMAGRSSGGATYWNQAGGASYGGGDGGNGVYSGSGEPGEQPGGGGGGTQSGTSGKGGDGQCNVTVF